MNVFELDLQIMTLFKLFILFTMTSSRYMDHTRLMDRVQALSDLSNVDDDDDVLSIIRDEIESVYSVDDVTDSEYQFDESMDCAFDILDVTDELNDLMPIIAQRLELEFSEHTQLTLYKAVGGFAFDFTLKCIRI